MADQKFDSFLILDFEATCEKDGKIQPQEIIEFPCLKMCPKTFEIQSIFHSYVKPVHHPRLTAFCTELTGITQDMVENERPFNDVWKEFDTWMKNEAMKDGGTFTFIMCGD